MSAYLIIQATVEDWAAFKPYTEVVPALVEHFGGKYIVQGKPELFEGNFDPASVVVSKWPSKTAAKAFWHSQEYRDAITLRQGTGTFNVMLVEGLED